jgi:cytochrome b
MRSVPVWDVPTRIFHWLLAVVVFVALIVEPEGGGFVFHAAMGYVALALVVARIPWGFIGSLHSRFADFIYRPTVLIDYARRLVRLDLPRYVGHNPLGGLMAFALLAATLAAAVTGLYAGKVGKGAAGPFAVTEAAPNLSELHGFFGNLIIALVVLHVLGVIVDVVLTRENIVRAMITGRKELDEAVAARERPLVGTRRAVLPVLAAAALAAYLFWITDFAAAPANGENEAQGESAGKD